MTKTTFDIVFMVGALAVMLFLKYFELLENYIPSSFIPLLIAYYLGQYGQRKFGNEKS